jgi:hypothetical protein
MNQVRIAEAHPDHLGFIRAHPLLSILDTSFACLRLNAIGSPLWSAGPYLCAHQHFLLAGGGGLL